MLKELEVAVAEDGKIVEGNDGLLDACDDRSWLGIQPILPLGSGVGRIEGEVLLGLIEVVHGE